MMNSKIGVNFNVKTTTQNGEVVCVTGNIPELGSWNHLGVVPLKLERKLADGCELWSASVNVGWREEVEYRYLKAHILEPQHEGETKDIMVTSWETNIKPRLITFTAPSGDEDIATYGTYGGTTHVDQGWLTGQTEVRLRLHSDPISMWKTRHQQQTYRIKCTAVDLKHHDDDTTSDEEMPMGPDEEESNHDLLTLGGANSIMVSMYRDGLMVPHNQPQFGTQYIEDDYLVFRVQTFDKDSLGYQFDFYVSHPSASDLDVPKHVASAYLLPVNLNETTGVKTIPISGVKNKPIGQLKVDYLIIRSLPRDILDMQVSYARHWSRNEPVDVGHRGLGSTYDNAPKCANGGSPRKCEVVKENTIASLSEAGGHGAHYVEFDVHLSRDGVPVIYHDFVVGLSLRQKKRQDSEMFKIPLHELSLEQLHMLKIIHGDHHHDNDDVSTDVEESIDERPFPTLQECFERIDPKIGFNVEIKYCMPLRKGGLEMDVKHYRERNNYIDMILYAVLLGAGTRSIVFSCFDPDVCSLIRMKQNKYPVLQLCNEPRPEWPAYLDLRTWNNSRAIAHCISEQLLGINPNTQDLLNKPEFVQQAKDHGLVVFCWGEETNTKENINRVKQLGVDGVIYDKIHELKALSQESMFTMDDEEEKIALLSDVGAIPSTTNGSLVLQKTSSRSLATSNNSTGAGFSGLIPSSNATEVMD